MTKSVLLFLFLGFFSSAFALDPNTDLTTHPIGYLAIAVFATSYIMVILEDKFHIRKSIPLLFGSGIIWLLLAYAYSQEGRGKELEELMLLYIGEYGELMLFLLVAMTYINSMIERGVFDRLRYVLVSRGFSAKAIYWITGILAFFISAIADNLTTALIMGTVIVTIGKDNKQFIIPSLISIVVAANAGGAFSPFGDITTLMVWQKGMVEFEQFFMLFPASMINWLVPAIIMNFMLGKNNDFSTGELEEVEVKPGAYGVVWLFLLTILTAVAFHNFLDLPATMGMMFGLGYLGIFAFRLTEKEWKEIVVQYGELTHDEKKEKHDQRRFDMFRHVAGAEWDTLLFFFGVIIAVGGLQKFGYLQLLSEYAYGEFGPLVANIGVGIASSIVDNIPIMFAVLSMNPTMDLSDWLLVTLTAGVGGSLLSIGSAAGVALMGQARGMYTFMSHLKYSPIILLGYAASIFFQRLIDGS